MSLLNRLKDRLIRGPLLAELLLEVLVGDRTLFYQSFEKASIMTSVEP
jgi:hypothetical protein